MSAYKLGQLPWSNETLEKAYWKSFMEVRENIKQHPGYDLHEQILSLKDALRMFNKASDLFFVTLQQFHTEVHERNIFNRTRSHDLREFEEKFQEILYLFASLARSLVEYSRKISTKVTIPGYNERISSNFSSNPCHVFIQELRNNLHHVTLHRPSWQLSTEEDHTHITKFTLDASELKQSGKWNKLAKEYLRENSQGVDIGTLIREYQAQVNEQHEWLHVAIAETEEGSMINDYLRCDRFLKIIGSRCEWQMLLSQVLIQAGPDPYQYLDQFFTQAEIKEIQRLPNKSKEQVDKVIEIIDDVGACNEDLRSLAYKAFGVINL